MEQVEPKVELCKCNVPATRQRMQSIQEGGNNCTRCGNLMAEHLYETIPTVINGVPNTVIADVTVHNPPPTIEGQDQDVLNPSDPDDTVIADPVVIQESIENQGAIEPTLEIEEPLQEDTGYVEPVNENPTGIIYENQGGAPLNEELAPTSTPNPGLDLGQELTVDPNIDNPSDNIQDSPDPNDSAIKTEGSHIEDQLSGTEVADGLLRLVTSSGVFGSTKSRKLSPDKPSIRWKAPTYNGKSECKHYFIKLENYFEANKIYASMEKIRVLKSSLEDSALDLFLTLSHTEQSNLKTLQKIFEAHFEPRGHKIIEAENFMKIRKKASETVSEFYASLRKKANDLQIEEPLVKEHSFKAWGEKHRNTAYLGKLKPWMII